MYSVSGRRIRQCGSIPSRTSRCRRALLFAAATAAVMSIGCLHHGFRVRGIEPYVSEPEPRRYRVIGQGEGSSSQFNLLWVIPVTPRIRFEQAVNEAVSSRGGDALIEVRTWTERQIWIVGMIETLHVRGTVIQYER